MFCIFAHDGIGAVSLKTLGYKFLESLCASYDETDNDGGGITDKSLRGISYGVYISHIGALGIGQKLIKFAIIK